MQRIAKIDDLLTQAKAAILNCQRALREGGECEALSSFVHTLLFITQTLEEFVEHVKPRANPETARELKEKLDTTKEEARALIERMTKLLGG